MTDEEKLMRMALDWGSPHVRRHAGRIMVILARFKEMGIPFRRTGRQVVIGPNDEYLGSYDHPHRKPERQRGVLAIRETGSHVNWRSGDPVIEIDTEADLAHFLVNPKDWLTKLA
jgi:hypothetical protein